jgi:hypothetical protein
MYWNKRRNSRSPARLHQCTFRGTGTTAAASFDDDRNMFQGTIAVVWKVDIQVPDDEDSTNETAGPC